jgi:hypothetical protein
VALVDVNREAVVSTAAAPETRPSQQDLPFVADVSDQSSVEAVMDDIALSASFVNVGRTQYPRHRTRMAGATEHALWPNAIAGDDRGEAQIRVTNHVTRSANSA